MSRITLSLSTPEANPLTEVQREIRVLITRKFVFLFAGIPLFLFTGIPPHCFSKGLCMIQFRVIEEFLLKSEVW